MFLLIRRKNYAKCFKNLCKKSKTKLKEAFRAFNLYFLDILEILDNLAKVKTYN